MPSAFNDRERDAIRTRLIEAAINALRRGGLGAASVAELAASAAIAKGSFYSFFGSKEELFMEALESIEERYRARYVDAAAGDGPPVERLAAAFEAAFRFAEEEPAVRNIDSSAVERLARALPPERVALHVQGDSEAMAGIAQTWKAAGLLRDDADAEELAGAAYAVFLVSLGLGSLPEPAKSATRALVVRGLAAALAAPIASALAAAAPGASTGRIDGAGRAVGKESGGRGTGPARRDKELGGGR